MISSLCWISTKSAATFPSKYEPTEQQLQEWTEQTNQEKEEVPMSVDEEEIDEELKEFHFDTYDQEG